MSQQLDAEPPPPVVVTIYDQPYRLRSGRGDEHLRRVAGLVDERMREVATHMKSLDMTRIAVLAALNLADELESLRADQAAAEAAADAATATPDPPNAPVSNAAAVSNAPADLPASSPQANANETGGARRSWFEDIFEAEDESPGQDSERRLSAELSSKLRPRRRD